MPRIRLCRRRGRVSDPPAGEVHTEPVVPALCWRYIVSAGELYDPAGLIQGIGYSGAAFGLDNPAAEEVSDVGPIPEGLYTIGPAFTHPVCGPVSMRLDPQPGTDTHGRDGFLMHGDNAAVNHTASHGCLIFSRPVRDAVAASDVRALVVLA